MEPSPKDIEWLLEELCTKLGFCMAGRDPDRFMTLAHQGSHIFAEAVLLAEALDPTDPTLEKRVRSGVHEFVAAHFERWASRAANQQLDSSRGTDEGG